MRLVSDKHGWWIVFDAEGEFADGPYEDYRTAKATMDEIERADAEDAEMQESVNKQEFVQ